LREVKKQSLETTEEEEKERKPPEMGERDKERDLKAVKADDAAVPIWLWNDTIVAGLDSPPACQGNMSDKVDRALDAF
jgi:hypothetical protein